jgi:hypothetical protein
VPEKSKHRERRSTASAVVNPLKADVSIKNILAIYKKNLAHSCVITPFSL